MPATTSEKLVKLATKKMKPDQALAYLSKRYAISKDYNYLIACVDLLSEFYEQVAFFHSALWTLKRLIHTHSANMPPGVVDKLEFKKLAIRYFRFVDAVKARIDLPERAQVSATPRRVVVLGQQFLRPPYSVTMCLLEFARLARLGGVEDVKIVVTNEYPEAPASTMERSLSAIPSTISGEGIYTYNTQDIPVYSYENQGFSLQGVQDLVSYIDQYAPDAIIQIGDGNVVGDLCAELRPCLVWPVSQTLSHARAPVHYYRSQSAPEQRIDWKRSKAAPPMMIPQTFDLMTLVANKNTFTRDNMGFSEDDFVFAIVGSRIEDELTFEFADCLVDILNASPRAKIFIAGTHNLSLWPQLARHPNRIRLLKYTGDLRSALSNCDAFLNPPRQGGGNAAYWSIFEGLPILTLKDCDVEMSIREDAAVDTLEDLKALAISVMTNPEMRDIYQQKSQRRENSLKSDQQSADIIFKDLNTCIEAFNRRLIEA